MWHTVMPRMCHATQHLLHVPPAPPQAKILGKYGGTPALGPAHVMMAAPRGNILKATASPAAIEIHYGKQEGKDASEMAQVGRALQRGLPTPGALQLRLVSSGASTAGLLARAVTWHQANGYSWRLGPCMPASC
jgi:hypothetical protein